MTTSVLPDLPTTKDALDFTSSARALAGILGGEGTATPITVGVFGTWGTGNTSLMRMIEAALIERSREGRLTVHTAWFDAWKYGREGDLWRALLMRALEAVRGVVAGRPTSEHSVWPGGEASPYPEEEQEKILRHLDDVAASLYRDVEREEQGRVEVDLGGLARGAAGLATRLALPFVPGAALLGELVKAAQGEAAKGALDGLFDAVQRQKVQVHRDRVRFLDQFQRDFQGLVQQHVVAHGRRLVVFVDDLDRCLPEKAVEVLEALKLFLDVEGCAFVVGVDREVIARGVRVRYRALEQAAEEGGRSLPLVSGSDYLEKIVQLPFMLPPVEAGQVVAFIREMGVRFPQGDGRCVEVFALGVERNPRKIKRCLNVFLLLWGLAEERGKAPGVIRPVRLAKVVVIQQRHPDLYHLLVEEPERLAWLERYFSGEVPRETELAILAEQQKAVFAEQMGQGVEDVPEEVIVDGMQGRTQRIETALEPFTARHALRLLLTLFEGEEDAVFADVPPEQLRDYIYLTRATAAPPEVEEVGVPVPDLVPVPGGSFLMGTPWEEIPTLVERYGGESGQYEDEMPRHLVDLPPFEIGKYPVTNRQYQAFVRDTGYRPPPGWDGDTYPAGKGDHPAVNVTWHDAVVYCRWLTERAGRACRLPTEAEWEKAARGSDGRQFPWGDEFDAEKCNTREGGIGGTTEVGRYPAGAGPYGALDMAGNVWEWCSSLFMPYPYGAGDGRENAEAWGDRVLRGGSWINNRWNCRCVCRNDAGPSGFSTSAGFRVTFPGAAERGRGGEEVA